MCAVGGRRGAETSKCSMVLPMFLFLMPLHTKLYLYPMPVTTLMDKDDSGLLAMATVMHLDQVDSLGSLQNAPRFIDDVVVCQLMSTMPLSIHFCLGLCNQSSDRVLLAVRFGWLCHGSLCILSRHQTSLVASCI